MRFLVMPRAAFLSVVAALLAACSTPPAAAGSGGGPDAGAESRTGALDDTLRIRLGQSTSADHGRLVLTFLARVSDSRCPANVVCVWMGDAAVRVAARVGGTTVDRVIHTALEPLSVSIDRYTVTVAGLFPYPGTEPSEGQAGVPTVLLRVVR